MRAVLFDFLNETMKENPKVVVLDADLAGATKTGVFQKAYAIYCDIYDEAGGIATIATLLAMNGINIKNIGILHNREFEDGVLRIEFYEDEACNKAERVLKERGRMDDYKLITELPNKVNIHFLRQKEQLGLGHAVLQARSFIGDEPFALLFLLKTYP